MTWLKLLAGLVALTQALTGYLERKRIVDDAEARDLADSLAALMDRIEQARRLRRGADPEREL